MQDKKKKKVPKIPLYIDIRHIFTKYSISLTLHITEQILELKYHLFRHRWQFQHLVKVLPPLSFCSHRFLALRSTGGNDHA